MFGKTKKNKKANPALEKVMEATSDTAIVIATDGLSKLEKKSLDDAEVADGVKESVLLVCADVLHGAKDGIKKDNANSALIEMNQDDSGGYTEDTVSPAREAVRISSREAVKFIKDNPHKVAEWAVIAGGLVKSAAPAIAKAAPAIARVGKLVIPAGAAVSLPAVAAGGVVLVAVGGSWYLYKRSKKNQNDGSGE